MIADTLPNTLAYISARMQEQDDTSDGNRKIRGKADGHTADLDRKARLRYEFHLFGGQLLRNQT